VPHIELAAPTLFYIGPLPVTNTIFTAWIVSLVLIVVSLRATGNMQMVPGRMQNAFELIIESLLNIGAQTADQRRARRFLPLIGSFFLFILVANWMGVLPLFGEGEFYVTHPASVAEPATTEGEAAAPAGAVDVEEVNVFRSANSDLNVTGAMALIVFIWSEWLGIRTGGLAYLKEFIWPGMLIEIISHIARSVALALRLFGNILAGEILLAIMSSLVKPLIPAAFMGFELFVGLVQALIFTLLTLAFMTLATEHGAHQEAEGAAHH